MTTSLGGLFLLGASYLGLLCCCGMAVERGWIPGRLLRHPLVYTLALGVYASAWAIYGSLEMVSQVGYGYLTYYLGVAGAFLLAPVLLLPIHRMARTYQLSSLADLFAFRFRSRWVGALITLVSIVAVLPLLALQVQSMGDSIYLLTGTGSPTLLALVFCTLVAMIAILFGARHTRLQARQDTLLSVIALESLVKLAAMLMLGGFALFGIFDGSADLQTWLDGPGHMQQAVIAPLDAGQWRTLLLLFFTAAFLTPHMFHIMVFTDTLTSRSLLQAGWSLALYLLLLALPVPLILWGAQYQGSLPAGLNPAYLAYSLSESPWIDGLAFIAGLAAASGTLIIISLALSGMILNHLVLLAYPPTYQPDLYRWLRWLRRGLVAMVILTGWLFYRLIGFQHDLTTLGLTAFIGMTQCLPGLLAILYWPGANRKGMVSGLIVGLTIWLLGSWLPLLTGMPAQVLIPPGLEVLAGEPAWYVVTVVSLSANALVFILVALISQTSEGERAAAEACSVDAVIRPKRLPLAATNGEEFKRHLTTALGEDVADREVSRALASLKQSAQDSRPYALRRLRDRIQANLSGLMGPAVAEDIVDRFLPYRNAGSAVTDDIHFVESRLEAYRSRLTGMARELDGLRRHHRRTLTQLPIGLCAFGDDGELLMWNQALTALSGIDSDSVVGARRDCLPPPWDELLGRILDSPQSHLYKQVVELNQGLRYLTLHKAELQGDEEERSGSVILVEDHSEMKWLENELVHAARLASIGQLAAGVAHEIGNPITGISSLAQNLRYDTDDPVILESAEQIQALTKRVSQIVASLVGFAHGGRHVSGSTFASVNLKRITDEALRLIHLAPSGQDIIYRNECSAELHVNGDAQRLSQVLVNLLSNARDASPLGSEIVIAAIPDAQGVTLSVIDQGQGIAENMRDHLFEPFTTTKPPGEGTGLGLPLVYSIIAEHHGQIHIDSPPPGLDCGTRINVWLPIYREDDDRYHESDSDC